MLHLLCGPGFVPCQNSGAVKRAAKMSRGAADPLTAVRNYWEEAASSQASAGNRLLPAAPGLGFPFAGLTPGTAVIPGSFPADVPSSSADVLQKDGAASKSKTLSLQGTADHPHLLVYVAQCGATISWLSSSNAVLLRRRDTSPACMAEGLELMPAFSPEPALLM